MKKLIVSGLLVMGMSLQAGVFEDVEKINKGLDGYIIGKVLSIDQMHIMDKKGLKSDNPNVGKFLASDTLLIAYNSKNHRVLAINKRYNKVEQVAVKSLIGNLIHDHDEPTAMAHDKMIYWIYDDKGKKLSQEDLKIWKKSLKEEKPKAKSLADFVQKGIDSNASKTSNKPQDKKEVKFNPYLSVKLSSDQPIMTKQKEPKPANVYLMISSDKLITTTTTAKK
ncbi:MAG: hypothetical protein U9N49_05505 [Campylobacterota bacterium]|nr:hypothetical protein [Campylobacterota bacterium]